MVGTMLWSVVLLLKSDMFKWLFHCRTCISAYSPTAIVDICLYACGWGQAFRSVKIHQSSKVSSRKFEELNGRGGLNWRESGTIYYLLVQRAAGPILYI